MWETHDREEEFKNYDGSEIMLTAALYDCTGYPSNVFSPMPGMRRLFTIIVFQHVTLARHSAK